MAENSTDQPRFVPNHQPGTGYDDPWSAVPKEPLEWGRSFRDSYRSGELPWPRADLFWGDDGGTTVMVNEYLEHIRDAKVAAARGDRDTVRRLRGEIEAGEHEFEHMDTYWAVETFAEMRAALTSLEDADFGCSETASDAAESSVAESEAERFVGPAPFYRRGRVFVQGLAFAAKGASKDRVAQERLEDADQLLRAVEACDNLEDLHDFIAGVAREAKRQFARRCLSVECDQDG